MTASSPFSKPHPEHSFLASPGSSYTYRDLQSFEILFDQFLQDRSFKKDQPIVLISSSCDALVFVIAACWRLGISFTCLNPQSSRKTLKKQLQALKPDLVLADTHHIDPLLWPQMEALNKLDPSAILDKSQTESPHPSSCQEITQEHVFGYFFTSGTSGEPKAVPLKRRQLVTTARASAQNIRPEANTCWLLCMPLNHIGGVSIILRSLLYGSAVYRLDRFDPQLVARLLTEHSRIVATSLVPTMLHRIIDDPSFATHPAFKAILLGGGPVTQSLLTACAEREIPVISSYGMTETCAQIAAHPINSGSPQSQKVGPVFEPNTVAIRNEQQQPLPANRSGLIWLKGPQVFDGYIASNNRNCFDVDGWFNTGDFGRMDEAGNLYIEARRTDRIVTGGENVSPFEVEEALQTIASIAEAAVTGLPHKKWGQQVVAVVVLKKEQKISASKIKQQLKQRLENYKIPKQIVQVSSLPKTEIGKIKREFLADFFK